MEKSNSNPTEFNSPKFGNIESLRPPDMPKGKLFRRETSERLVERPKQNHQKYSWGEPGDIAREAIDKKIDYLDSVVNKYPLPLFSENKLREIEKFIHELGMDTKPVFFLKNDDIEEFKYEGLEGDLGGRHDYILDVVLINADSADSYRGAELLLEGTIVHELTHSSSQNDLVFNFQKESNKVDIGQGGRSGMQTMLEKNSELPIVMGEAFEEGFSDYVRLLYLQHISFDPLSYIEPGEDQYAFIAPKQSEFFNSVKSYSLKNQRKIDAANTQEERAVILKKILTKIDFKNKIIYLNPRLLNVRKDSREGTAAMSTGVGYPLLAESFELLILEDPTILQSFIRARKNVEGLREIAKKLNSIEPGLYIKLRNLNSKIKDEFEFYKTVVQALDRKYFSDGRPKENTK